MTISYPFDSLSFLTIIGIIMKAPALILCLSLAYSGYVSADENLNEQFKSAYQGYLAAQQAADDALPFAEQAYILGQKVYGLQSDNTANLAVNYANEIANTNKELKAKRYQLFNTAYEILLNNHSAKSLELVDPLSGMANSAPSANRAADLYEQVIELLDKQGLPKLAADLKLSAAKDLAYNYRGSKYLTARKYLEQADEYYSKNLPENSIERIKADFLVAAFAQGKKRYSTAIERLNRVVSVFDKELSFDHQAELSAHSKLVYLYEKEGQSDEATKHCIAIAKMVPWKEDQEQTPLYREPPEYPMNKAKQRRDGYVQMRFDVSKTGFVENIEVIKSKGGAAFEREAVKAMEKWRYAPKFENGQAVVATSKVQLDFKIGS